MLAVKAYSWNVLVCLIITVSAVGECGASSVSEPTAFIIDVAETYQKSSFSGEFVTSRNGVSARFRVSRWINDGRLFERVDRVGTDDIYTVLRLEQQIINIYPGKTLSRMEVGYQVNPLEQLQSRLEDISSFYQVSTLASTDERVAERPVTGLQFTPLDNHRYAYAIWVDNLTHLPLKFEYAWEGGVLETTEFLELTNNPSLNSTFFEVPAGLAEVASLEAMLKEVPIWRTSWLPPGFRALDGAITRPTDSNREHMGPRRMYGDGIATISVFVQPMMPGVKDGASGMFRSGALSMVSLPREIAGKVWQVTALGEAPPLTLKMISKHVEFVSKP